MTDDVYLVGSLDGKIRAYNAATGRQVWTSPATASVSSNLTGAGDGLFFGAGAPRMFGGMGGNGVFAFGLGGKITG